MSHLVRKEVYDIFETKDPTKDQIRKYKRPGKEWFSDDVYTYARSDFILKIIKNCIGSKQKKEKGKEKEKEEKIDELRIKLGLEIT